MANRKRYHVLPNGKKVHLSGWRPDRPDSRDSLYARPKLTADAVAKLPAQFLEQWPIWKTKLVVMNQGSVGDCTANGGDEVMRWPWWKAHVTDIPQFSRFFLYWATREKMGVPPDEDSGASIRDMMMTLVQVGVCLEKFWQSDDPDSGLWQMKPPKEAWADAAQHKIVSAHPVPDLHALKLEICRWYPVVFGFTVYDSMMTDAVGKTGVVPIPGPSESVQGGHCVVAVGYCDQRKAVLCINSWGTDWGDGGFFWLPYHFWEAGLADDAWVAHTEKGVPLP